MLFDLNQEERAKIVSLFNQHETNLDYFLYVRDVLSNASPILNKEDIFQIKEKESFDKRRYYFDLLYKKLEPTNAFIKKEMLWDTQLLSADDFLSNPYLKAINDLTFECDDWKLDKRVIKAYSLFPYQEEYHYASNYNIKMGLGLFDKVYNYPSISLFDTEWMSLNPHEIRTMETPIILARGKVLTLGLGLGYFSYMVHLKDEVKEVHIVEMDLELIKLFNKYLLPLFPHPEKIHIHKADAFQFIKQIKDKDFDFIFADLWHNVSDGVEMYLPLKRTFDSFRFTQVNYWIEGAIVTYFRMLVIGVLKDEFYKIENDYDELQTMIKNKLNNVTIKNSYELDSLLSIKGLNELMR